MKVFYARRTAIKIPVLLCARFWSALTCPRFQKRRVVAALQISALLIISVQPTLPQDALPDLVRRIKPSAVAIETFDARGEKLSRGSGFFIDLDRVVTNRHVIEGAYRAEVHLNSGHTFQVKNVIAVDPEGDVALLKVDAPPNLVRPLSLDRTSPQEGESV